MIPTHHSGELASIINLIHERTGIVLIDDHRIHTAKRALEQLIADVQVHDLAGLYVKLAALHTDHALWKQLVQALTIGETYFFRNSAYINALQNHVWPQIIQEKRQRGHHSLRVWSAGSSTGEEIYTMAMMLRDLISDHDQWSFYLVGTDINDEFLERARRAVYRGHSFRSETPSHIQPRWFTQQADGYHLKPEVKQMVHFKKLNLVEELYPSVVNGFEDFDLILCRNVTIYFDDETTRKVLDRLRLSLRDGGWLIIGHAEPMLVKSLDLQAHTFNNAVFYQRQKAAKPPQYSSAIRPVFPAMTRTPKPERKPRSTSSLPQRQSRPTGSSLPQRTKRHTAQELCDLAKADADAGRWQDALTKLTKAEAQNSLMPQVHFLRALIYREQGAAKQANQALRKAIYCDANYTMALYTLGEMYEQQGQINDARGQWRNAIRSLERVDLAAPVPGGDDLTGEMVMSLITFKLEQYGG